MVIVLTFGQNKSLATRRSISATKFLAQTTIQIGYHYLLYVIFCSAVTPHHTQVTQVSQVIQVAQVTQVTQITQDTNIQSSKSKIGEPVFICFV